MVLLILLVVLQDTKDVAQEGPSNGKEDSGKDSGKGEFIKLKVVGQVCYGLYLN